LDIAYRYSDYSTDKQTNTYKFAGEWMIVPSFRLRASYQRAVRVGNVHELFAPLRNSFGNGPDTCLGTNPTSTLEECQLTGLSTAQYGTLPDVDEDDDFFQTKAGGNQQLDPEESDTVSFGFIFNPEFLPELNLSADYFEIEITDAIAESDSTFIFNQCIATGNAHFCDAINRDPTTGTLFRGEGHVFAPNTNIGFIKTSGIDIVADYGLEIGRSGDLRFSLVATYLDTWDWQELPGQPAFDCVGIHEGGPCVRPRPEWISNFRTTWSTPWDASASLLWRHISESEDLSGFGNDFASFDYIDLAGFWEISEGVIVRAGINNLLDKDPPITSFGSGNTIPEAYDALGRYWFTGVSVRF
jgi:outer membrane receptor protein involved in Fe transport